MAQASIDHAIACRDTIREKAFELAESGTFSDWAAVKLALAATSDAGHLQHVFASPFCRLDLDQRCRAARTGGPLRDIALGSTSGADPLPGSRQRRRKSNPARKDAELAGLAREIAAVLGDGNARTAAQVAQQLGAEARNVRRALRAMLANGEVHIAGRDARAEGGAAARLFRPGRAADRGGSAADNAARVWPRPDPVVLHAMDAFARHA
ncbi:MAG TPA: hypothetical protein VIH96_08775 [Paraburkholderia sp.]|jgi:hypothetical protein